MDEEQVQLMKRRGGVGHDLSAIRPTGSNVQNCALTSTGIVPFMERYSNSTREVAQGGRRGALMLTISIKHPDAEKFIDAKMTEGRITGANVSVRIDDEFMQCVKNGTPYTQQYPIHSDTPKVVQQVDAAKLWTKIVYNAWKSAEPGVLFWDTIHREAVPDCYASDGFLSNHQINVNFKHVFDTLGTALYADATYSLDHNKSISDREQPFYFGDFLAPTQNNSHYYSISHPSRMHVATAKLDFEHPFNDRLSLECGVKTSFVKNRNNNINYLNDSLMENKSNHFIYTENIAAAYIQANFQPDQLVTIQAGLRAEYAHVVGNLVTTGEVNKQDYADVFPSLQIDYQLPKMNTLSFALRSRISRPDYHDLNPFVDGA